MTIDFQALLQIVKANEEAQHFNLHLWIAPSNRNSSCGTYGCLVGNWLLKYSHDKLVLKDNFPSSPNRHELVHSSSFQDISKAIGISYKESIFLFDKSNPLNTHHSKAISKSPYYIRDSHIKDKAIARLRKFIYYKLRKQELLGLERETKEQRERYEQSRSREGNWNFVQMALQEV